MFSFSQIKSYLQCPKRYEFSYLGDFEFEEKNSLFLLQGNILHEALRRLYQRISFFSLPSETELIKYATEKREEILPQHDFFDPQAETVQSTLAEMIHLLKSYYQQHHPFSADSTIALEQKLFSKLGTHTFSATVDRIAKRGQTFIIYDYKTNKKLTPEIEASHKEQALLYAGIVLENYQKYFQKLEIRIEFLYLQKTTSRIADQAEIQPVQQHYLALADEISSKKDAFKELNDPAIFPTNKGEPCKRCPFMDLCPAFSSLPSELETSSLTAKSIQHLAQEYLAVHNSVKSLEQEKQTLKEQLEQYLQDSDYQRIFGNDYQISFSLKDNRTIKDEAALRQLLAEKGLLDESKTLDKNKVKKLFEAGVIPSDLIEEKVVTSLLQKKG